MSDPKPTIGEPNEPVPTGAQSEAQSPGESESVPTVSPDESGAVPPASANVPEAEADGAARQTDSEPVAAGTPGPAPEAPAPAPPATTAPAPATPATSATPPRSDGMLVLGAPAPAEPAPPPPPAAPDSPPCLECGGRFGPDGYCERCGARRPDPRHRYEREAPEGDRAGAWVAGVCDRGIRHATNEDALALDASRDTASGGPDRRAAMVVCDGVSTARRSARASQAAADAALAVLTASRSRGLAGVASAHAGALAGRLDAATDAASQAVLDVAYGPEAPEDVVETGIPHISDPACTYVAAVIDGDVALVGSVGDSRAYWMPDDGPALLLTTDDSWAEEQIAVGMPRAQAESAPRAHTITRWLGVDAPDHTPRKTSLRLDAPGWLLLCSDGLWNYASEPEELARVFADSTAGLARPVRPLPLARRLVEWANAQGGRDNITVALARVDAPGTNATGTNATDTTDAGDATDTADAGHNRAARTEPLPTIEADPTSTQEEDR